MHKKVTPKEGRIFPVQEVQRQVGYEWAIPKKLYNMIASAGRRMNYQGEVKEGNGMYNYGVVIRLGKSVYIDLDAFDEWLRSKAVEVDNGDSCYE